MYLHLDSIEFSNIERRPSWPLCIKQSIVASQEDGITCARKHVILYVDSFQQCPSHKEIFLNYESTRGNSRR